MKKHIIIILLLISIFSLTGCVNKKDRVIIYSSMEEERNQALEKKLKEKFPNVDTKVQHMATGNLAAKIKAEGTNTEADIIVDLETSHINNLKDNFASINSFDTSSYLDEVDTSNNYITWTKYSLGIILDKQYFEKNNLPIPKTYDDLLNPVYKDLIAMPDPTVSGSGYAFLLNMKNLKGEDAAIEYFKKLKANIREFTPSGSGSTNLLKQGEIAIAMGMLSQAAYAITEGYDFEVIKLDTNFPYNETSTGIIKGREKRKNVKDVFQYIITDFSKYDKEVFIPTELFKDQKTNVKNYPNDVIDADMTDIESIEIKEKLTKRWDEING